LKIFYKNIIFLIKKLKCRIIADNKLFIIGVLIAELNKFTQNASNLADIEIYIKK